ncbi:unnamed protein product [Clonostachys rosea]|uniref:F-box domain-containing protein n=1 Tax=Bionectria ochroleuca TaxID=29856 RepID=A0ABY6U523_BIOOC|nr:unnamed protein product [Clonostachys rosea]
MSFFLKIPLEIRLVIFRWVMCSRNLPPSGPSENRADRKILQDTEGFTFVGLWHLVPTNPALSLLLVNRQIHHEVKKLVPCLSTDCHVDVMYVKESGVWPTWSISALPQTRYTGSLYATIRTFDPPDILENKYRHRIIADGDEQSSTVLHWSFYWLLAKFLDYGPGLLRPSPSERIRSTISSLYAVNQVIIDVVAPGSGSGHKSILVDDERYEVAKKELERFPIHDDVSIPIEERLAIYLSGYLDRILSFDVNMVDRGLILYEQIIDRITVTVNGKEFRVFDLEARLMKEEVRWRREIPDSNEKLKPFLEKWTHWVGERRQRMREWLEIDDAGKPTSTLPSF